MKKLSMIALLFIPSLIIANTKVEVNGEVRDKETGETLMNAHVYINEHFGTVTDDNGLFTLEIPAEFKNEKLHISFLGYQTFELPVKSLKDEFLKVDLEIGAIWLNNVVVEADPWEDFRDIIGELSAMYNSKKELYGAIYAELEELEKLSNEKLDAENQRNEGSTSIRGQEIEGSILPGIIAFCIASLGLAFMAGPFLKYVNKKS